MLASCLDALPETGALSFAGAMLARGTDAVRLVARMPGDKLPQYLARIGYPGDRAEVAAIVAGLFRGARVRCNLDISGQVHERIGIEAFVSGRGAARALAWETVLARLVEHGLCTPLKSACLMRWTGRTRARLAHDAEPSRVFRITSHVKVSREKGKAAEATHTRSSSGASRAAFSTR